MAAAASASAAASPSLWRSVVIEKKGGGASGQGLDGSDAGVAIRFVRCRWDRIADRACVRCRRSRRRRHFAAKLIEGWVAEPVVRLRVGGIEAYIGLTGFY